VNAFKCACRRIFATSSGRELSQQNANPVVSIGCLFTTDSSKQRLLRSMSPDRYKPTDPLELFQENSQPRLAVFVTTAISSGGRLMNWPKGCPCYIGQCTFSRHEYPRSQISVITWKQTPSLQSNRKISLDLRNPTMGDCIELKSRDTRVIPVKSATHNNRCSTVCS